MRRRTRLRRQIPKAVTLQRTVAKRVRALRQSRGMTQAELGGGVLTRAGISSLENGVTAPSLHMLAFLARRLKVRVRDLLPPGA
jgi:transcriptional regulator with XRE-family HTH domain